MPDQRNPDTRQHRARVRGRLEREHGEREEEPSKGLLERLPGVAVIGWALVLLILAGYFVWLYAQMGGGTALGASPMLGVLGAAVLGICAAGAAFWLGSRAKRR